MDLPRRRLRPLPLAAALAAGSSLAQTAAPPDGAASAPVVLPAVRATAEAETATGPVHGYSARRSATATKTDTPLLETPQAVSVVTRQRIEDQGATGLQDALNYAAGVRSDAFGLDSRTDSVVVRGTDPAIYLDGLRQQLGGYYTSTTRTEPYTLERIEVLRGPSGILFGQGSTGGLVNMVSKRPLADAQREVGVQLGNFNRRQIQADLTSPLSADGQWLYRIVALGRDADTQVDSISDDRVVFAPSLTWRPSPATSWTFQALHQKDKAGSTLQFPPWSGSGAPNPNGRIPTHRLIGEPGLDYYDSTRNALGWLFEHRFGDTWTLRQNLRVAHNEVDFRTFYWAFTDPAYIDEAQRLLHRSQFEGLTRHRVATADQHLEGRFATGAVRHQLLLGLDMVRSRQVERSAFDSSDIPGSGLTPIDVFTPTYTGYSPPARSDFGPATRLEHAGVYLQDQLRFGDGWLVVAGLRHDRANNKLEGSEDEKSQATTKRLALLRTLPGGWSPYVSYSESFTPVAGRSLAGTRFKPTRGEQVELGLKLQPEDRDYSAGIAVFELKENNRLVPSPDNPLDSVQAGETKNRGVELEVTGKLTPWFEVAAHYNYLDIDGSRDDPNLIFGGNPRHQAAVWGKASIAQGWALALGLRYFSSFTDGPAPTVPALRLVDGALSYDSGPWRYALTVQNLADKSYVSTCAARGDCFYGARRTAIVSATYRY